jgi:hypothetical protein
MWGVDDIFWSGGPWVPAVPVTRIPSHTTTELQNFLTNATTYLDLNVQHLLPSKALVHYGDETDGGIPADSCISFFNTSLYPFLSNKQIDPLIQSDSQYGNRCSAYTQANVTFANYMNNSEWPSIWLNVGPVSSAIRTPGYILHKNELCASWDGSLLQDVAHPFIFIGPDCGLAGVFRESPVDPGFPEMFTVGAANKPSAVAWVGAQSGGNEMLHLVWWRLWLWAWTKTTHVHDTYWLSLRTFAALHPGQIEYACGMEYIGLPMPWPLPEGTSAISQEPRGGTILKVTPSPISSRAQIAYSLPELPEGATVDVACFDAGGRLVRSIHDPGKSGILVWDAENDAGVPLASGVYFVTLNLNKVRLETTKVVVAR